MKQFAKEFFGAVAMAAIGAGLIGLVAIGVGSSVLWSFGVGEAKAALSSEGMTCPSGYTNASPSVCVTKSTTLAPITTSCLPYSPGIPPGAYEATFTLSLAHFSGTVVGAQNSSIGLYSDSSCTVPFDPRGEFAHALTTFSPTTSAGVQFATHQSIALSKYSGGTVYWKSVQNVGTTGGSIAASGRLTAYTNK